MKEIKLLEQLTGKKIVLDESIGSDYMDYGNIINKGLLKDNSEFTINNVKLVDAESDDFSGKGSGLLSFTYQAKPLKQEIEYSIYISDQKDESADIAVDIFIESGEKSKTYNYFLKNEHMPNFSYKLVSLIKDTIKVFSKEL